MNKTILVTGGGGEIGFSIIQYFYKKNYNVIIVGLMRSKSIKQIKKTIGSKQSLVFNVELNNKKNIQKIIKKSLKKFRSIDILVNCAGIQFVSPIEKYPEKIWRKMLDINLTVPFLMIKEILPLMRKNKFGRIINIASTHGLISSINKSAYTASKHGLVGLTKGVALETAKENITCNSICPGFALTNLIQDQINFIADRPGHDYRYAIDASRIQKELNWTPMHSFEEGLQKTILWYLENEEWWRALLLKTKLDLRQGTLQ